MKKITLLFLSAGIIVFSAFTLATGKWVSKAAHVNFFSHTDAEDIKADNYKVVSTLDQATGEIVYSVPMQSFEFEKALMQKHFNSDKFLDTKTYPKAKFKGKITNLSEINFSKDGTYNTTVTGEMTIKATTKTVTEKGTITISGSATKVSAKTKFKIVLADYGVAFEKGKPASNISKTVDVTVNAEYSPE